MKRVGTIFFCFLLFSTTLSLALQTSPQVPVSQNTASSADAPATYTLPPDKLQKATALYKLRGKLRIVDTVFSVAVLLALLYFGVVARYRDWAERGSRYSFLQAMIVIPLFLLTTDVLALPLDAYEHSVSRAYGLSVQGWGSWFGDWLKGEAISFILGIVLLWLMILIIRKSPRRWWFYFWFPAYAMFVLLIYSGPVIIDPLFNKFEPLQKNHPQLVEAIERVTQRGGLSIPRSRMYEMKASEKTTELNAYVTGFGASKRVVVWDTTMEKLDQPEILFVFGHEMGHYVLNHIIYGLVLGGLGLFIGLYVLYVLAGWTLRHFQQRWHIRELGDWASLPMIFLIFGIMSFFSTPIGSAISRQLEHNADIYGLEVTHGINPNPQAAAARSFQTLGEVSLDYPYPSRLVVFWFYDHPPISDRVRFAHDYDPWSKGEQPKYVR